VARSLRDLHGRDRDRAGPDHGDERDLDGSYTGTGLGIFTGGEPSLSGRSATFAFRGRCFSGKGRNHHRPRATSRISRKSDHLVNGTDDILERRRPSEINNATDGPIRRGKPAARRYVKTLNHSTEFTIFIPNDRHCPGLCGGHCHNDGTLKKTAGTGTSSITTQSTIRNSSTSRSHNSLPRPWTIRAERSQSPGAVSRFDGRAMSLLANIHRQGRGHRIAGERHVHLLPQGCCIPSSPAACSSGREHIDAGAGALTISAGDQINLSNTEPTSS